MLVPISVGLCFFVGAILIAGAVGVVSKKPTPKKTLWAGVILLCLGLGGSLLVNLIPLEPPNITQVTISYVGNFYLLVASIGGNLVAGAAVMASGKPTAQLDGDITGKISASAIPGQHYILDGKFTGKAAPAQNP